jgi:hypothetical protein
MPAEVQVKDKSLSVTQQIGVAVGALLESEQMALVTWTIEVRVHSLASICARAILNNDIGLPHLLDPEGRLSSSERDRLPHGRPASCDLRLDRRGSQSSDDGRAATLRGCARQVHRSL